MNRETMRELKRDEITGIKVTRINWIGHIWKAGPKHPLRKLLECESEQKTT